MDRQTAQLVRFANHRGKPLLVTEIGTFYYGWRFNNPSGAASIDATLTVAEGVIRGLNIGADCFAFWSLMNPNTIDGCWSAMEIREGKLIRCGFPFAVYGMLSRTLRPGSRVYPLGVESESGRNSLHGSLLERPDGSWAAVIVNDSPTQNAEVVLKLLQEIPHQAWEVKITDRVRLNKTLPTLRPDVDSKLEFTAPAFSVLTIEGR
jgi:hypothetical protein